MKTEEIDKNCELGNHREGTIPPACESVCFIYRGACPVTPSQRENIREWRLLLVVVHPNCIMRLFFPATMRLTSGSCEDRIW